jgi:hypothetical protein
MPVCMSFTRSPEVVARIGNTDYLWPALLPAMTLTCAVKQIHWNSHFCCVMVTLPYDCHSGHRSCSLMICALKGFTHTQVVWATGIGCCLTCPLLLRQESSLLMALAFTFSNPWWLVSNPLLARRRDPGFLKTTKTWLVVCLTWLAVCVF